MQLKPFIRFQHQIHLVSAKIKRPQQKLFFVKFLSLHKDLYLQNISEDYARNKEICRRE